MPLSEASTIGVSITANRLIHPRILKAVVKEKWMDFAFKLEIEPRKAILTHSIKHSVLTFYLEYSVSTINAECV